MHGKTTVSGFDASTVESRPGLTLPSIRRLFLLKPNCGWTCFGLKEVNCVPVVIVEMWEGRTVEQKEKLIKGLTRAFEEGLGTKPESLHIVIHDVPKTNWGTKGEQASKLST